MVPWAPPWMIAERSQFGLKTKKQVNEQNLEHREYCKHFTLLGFLRGFGLFSDAHKNDLYWQYEDTEKLGDNRMKQMQFYSKFEWVAN